MVDQVKVEVEAVKMEAASNQAQTKESEAIPMAKSDEGLTANVIQEKPRPESRQPSELILSAEIIDDE